MKASVYLMITGLLVFICIVARIVTKPYNGKKELIGSCAQILFGGYFLAFYFAIFFPWLNTFEYHQDGSLEQTRWCFRKRGKIMDSTRAIPKLLRNQSGRTLELIWIGYGAQTTRRDKLAPGEEVYFDLEVTAIQTGSTFPKTLSSGSEPAYLILVTEEGSVPADSIARWQATKRKWTEAWEIPVDNGY